MSVQFNWEEVPTVETVETDQEAAELLRLALRKVELDPKDYIGWDTETHGKKIPIKSKPLDWMTDTVTFWSMSFALDDSGERKYRRWCIKGEYFYYFYPLLESPLLNIAGWNLKYDAHIAYNCGVNIWNARQPIDGLALAQTHDENRRSHGLKTCAKDWCGLSMTPYKSLFDGVRDGQGKKAKEYETSLLELWELGHKIIVADYASYDAYAHLRTVEWLIHHVGMVPINEGYSLWDYFCDTEVPFTELLWRMERRGMYFDIDEMKRKLPDIDGRIEDIEKQINQLAGRPININSPKQIAEFLFLDPGGLQLPPVKMTATNQPSTDEEVMDALVEAGNKVAGKIIEARKLGKTRSTYIDALIKLCEHFGDHRIHPSFNQLGARTGRLSTQHPNSQNFPRPGHDEWGIRKAFTAPPGYKLIVADYEQVEMRIMAHMSGDDRMLKAIREGKDLHSFTVAAMDPEITYEEVVAAKKAEKPDDRQKFLLDKRQANKAVGFGIIYGAGPPKIATSIPITEADWQQKINEMEDKKFQRRLKNIMKNNPLLTEDKAVELVGKQAFAAQKIQEYFQVFPGVKGFMDYTPQACRHTMYYDENNDDREWSFEQRTVGAKDLSVSGHDAPFGYVRTLLGRLRRLPDIDHRKYFYKSEAERQAVNTRIQGSAADITKAAMLRIEFSKKLQKLGVSILNQVHDEIVMQVPEENAEAAAPLVTQYMEHPFGDGPEDDALCIPIPVDLKIVDRWADAK